ncbi:MAG: TatD family hydrolase [Candidatus Micrarchaeota archaeon]|nr:TatD family hydrolase [Candidatus Micrarchaeota archaeon]
MDFATSNLIGAIDSHCHIQDFAYPEKVIKECKELGLSALITCSASIHDMEKAIGLADNNKGFLYYTVGLHPLFSIKFGKKEIDQHLFKLKLMPDASFVGIGEVGLDYFLIKEKKDRELSKEIFIKFIEIANLLKKPIIIHCREAYPDVLDILSSEFRGTAVFHYFNQPEYADEIVKKGWYLSVPITISKQKIKTLIPYKLDNIILETDSPIKLDNREITPLGIGELIEKICVVTDIEKEKLIEKTTNNVKKVFRI